MTLAYFLWGTGNRTYVRWGSIHGVAMYAGSIRLVTVQHKPKIKCLEVVAVTVHVQSLSLLLLDTTNGGRENFEFYLGRMVRACMRYAEY